MNSNDLLDMIGEARDSYILEANRQRGNAVRKHHSLKRILLIAVAAALVASLVGCAAAVIFGLREMTLGTVIRQQDAQYLPNGETTPATEVTKNVISLQGFAGSKNYQATKEWYEFLNSYDPDGAIRSGLRDGDIHIPEEYSSYGCYTQEMMDEVDRICEKYGLSLQGRSWDERDTGFVFEAVGISGIIQKDTVAEAVCSWGYFCEDGSFHVEGEISLTGDGNPWPYEVNYQLISAMKSSFETSALSIGTIEDYEQWEYTLADGSQALLALSKEKALILVDRESFFATVNIINPAVNDWIKGDTQYMTREALQAIADTFDFSYDPQKPGKEAIALAQARLEEEIAKSLESAKDQDPYSHYDKSYDAWIAYLICDAYHPEKLGYTFEDLNGDGVAELLVGQDGYFEYVFTAENGETKAVVDPYMVGDSYFYLCEDNAIAQVSDDQCLKNRVFIARPTWRFGRLVGSEIKWERTLVYDPWEDSGNPWQEVVSEEGAQLRYKPLTEQEFYSVIASYQRIYLQTAPLADYPLEQQVSRDPDKMYPYPIYGDFQDLVLSRLEDPNEGFTYRFALLDFDGDGQQELIFDEDSVCSVFTMTNGELNKIISGYDLTVCGEKLLRKIEYYGTENYSVTYFRVLEGNRTEIVEYLRYDADMSPGNPWLRSKDASGFDGSLVAVSQTEFQSIMEQYPEAEVDMKSLEAYPFE